MISHEDGHIFVDNSRLFASETLSFTILLWSHDLPNILFMFPFGWSHDLPRFSMASMQCLINWKPMSSSKPENKCHFIRARMENLSAINKWSV